MYMSRIPAPPTTIAAGIVVLLFGIVWWLSAADLTFVGSFVAAVIVAGLVGGSIRFFLSSAEGRGERGNRLLELMQRSSEVRRGIRDETTGLLNRWYLERRLDEEAARCKRYGHPMAVIVLKAVAIDLARFSLDGWQQESASAARRCAQVIRNVDLSASLAPFEFAMCLVHCDRNGANAAIKRILDEFRDYECQIGISVYPDDDCEPRALIELARVRSRELEAA
jgi:GGDEF domain-containing protein